MAREVPLFAGEGVLLDGAHARLKLGDAVDQEERIAMRDERLDASAVEWGHGGSLASDHDAAWATTSRAQDTNRVARSRASRASASDARRASYSTRFFLFKSARSCAARWPTLGARSPTVQQVDGSLMVRVGGMLAEHRNTDSIVRCDRSVGSMRASPRL